MFELMGSIIGLLAWFLFLEIIASGGKCLEKKPQNNDIKNYWDSDDHNWAENVAEYFRQKREDKGSSRRIYHT